MDKRANQKKDCSDTDKRADRQEDARETDKTGNQIEATTDTNKTVNQKKDAKSKLKQPIWRKMPMRKILEKKRQTKKLNRKKMPT